MAPGTYAGDPLTARSNAWNATCHVRKAAVTSGWRRPDRGINPLYSQISTRLALHNWEVCVCFS